ncbi:FixH family protein [Flavicella sp.]|uniref:FixH family protein n=1 Tax=Flavicella sp. TaxID=2957742 RepID=UPI003015C734
MKKINWGSGIALALVFFIGFILYFVIKISTDSKYDNDLVVEDYYKYELEYQHRIDKLNNAKNLAQNITIRKVANGVFVDFPKDIEQEKIKGTIYLYRPSNKVLDVTLPIILTKHTQFISNEVLIGGRWNIHVNWSVEDEDYFFLHSLNN